MLFKRYLFLAACVLLFIFGFIGYFTWTRAQVDEQFRDEREKFNVQGVTLTTTATPESTPAPTPVATAPEATPMAPTASTNSATDASAPATPDTSSSVVTNTPPVTTDNPAPAMNPAAADPNAAGTAATPAPATPATDASTNAPTPATPPDTNSAPMAPSTMNNSRDSIRSFLVRASYHPGASVQIAAIEPAAPVTNAPVSATPATNAGIPSAPATNASSSVAPMNFGTGHPAAVPTSVIVLLYHQFVPPGAHVDPKFEWTMHEDVFESEMKYIHDNGYHVVPMSDLIKFLNHQIGLPPNSVVITIDDGYKSAIVYAAPILKKYGYPWTYFVYPDFITVNEGKGAASWNDLLALQADGVDIESHSMTHPTLTKHRQKWKGSLHDLSPEEYDEWLTNETLGAKTLLEQKMGKPIICFAYPYGAHNKEVEAKAIAAGYQYIFTVEDNPVRIGTDPHSIGRYTITTPVEKDFTAYLHQGALGLADADPAPGTTISNPRPVITAVLGYAGDLDPNSIETSIRDFGEVKHDFDPKTSTIRLYLPRDLIQPVTLVSIRVKDAQSGKYMVANWRFNFQPAGGTSETHAPIAPTTNGAPITTNAPATSETPMAASTNIAPAASTATSIPVAPVAKPATNDAPINLKSHQD